MNNLLIICVRTIKNFILQNNFFACLCISSSLYVLFSPLFFLEIILLAQIYWNRRFQICIIKSLQTFQLHLYACIDTSESNVCLVLYAMLYNSCGAPCSQLYLKFSHCSHPHREQSHL